MQFHSFLKNISFAYLFIHRSCITQGNIVLKVVNSRCLEKVKTAEQQQQQQLKQ